MFLKNYITLYTDYENGKKKGVQVFKSLIETITKNYKILDVYTKYDNEKKNLYFCYEIYDSAEYFKVLKMMSDIEK